MSVRSCSCCFTRFVLPVVRDFCANKNQAGADVAERLYNLIPLLEAYGFITGLIKLIERIIQIYLGSVRESLPWRNLTLPVRLLTHLLQLNNIYLHF